MIECFEKAKKLPPYVYDQDKITRLNNLISTAKQRIRNPDVNLSSSDK